MFIEVLDGTFPARAWQRAHGDDLTEAALTNGAGQWTWHVHGWGVTLEIEFDTEPRRDRFRALPAVTAALDAVPDPDRGLLVYRAAAAAQAPGCRASPAPSHWPTRARCRPRRWSTACGWPPRNRRCSSSARPAEHSTG